MRAGYNEVGPQIKEIGGYSTKLIECFWGVGITYIGLGGSDLMEEVLNLEIIKKI